VRFPRLPVWGDIAAVGRSDAAYARRFYASQAGRGSVIGSPGTDLIWAGGRLVDAWPANPDENESSHVRESNVETLLIRLHPPVALGIHFASSQGIVRLAATVVGTVIGAWAGLHVTSGGFGLTAPLLAIVGATAGANLIVLVLDILRDSEVAVRRGVLVRHVPGHSA